MKFSNIRLVLAAAMTLAGATASLAAEELVCSAKYIVGANETPKAGLVYKKTVEDRLGKPVAIIHAKADRDNNLPGFSASYNGATKLVMIMLAVKGEGTELESSSTAKILATESVTHVVSDAKRAQNDTYQTSVTCTLNAAPAQK